MAIRDMNDPRYFSDANMDALGTEASFSDYGPGPNEDLDAVRSMSAAVRTGLASAPDEPLDFGTPPPAAPSADAVDQLADAVLARVMQKLAEQ